MADLGQYRLLEKMGEGSMATVWRARHLVTGVDAAVKVVEGTDETFERALIREVRAASALNHRGIVALHSGGRVDPGVAADSGDDLDADAPWIAMAFAEHGPLDPSKLTGWSHLERLLREILEALAYAHARAVVHRDLKPANILIHGDDRRYMLVDFGLAQLDHGRTFTTTPMAGDPNYLAPEQLLDQWREHGPWTDLYALGCVAYEVLYGAAPFAAEDAFTTVEGHLNTRPRYEGPRFEVPEGFVAWLDRLLAKDVGERFKRATDALETLPGAHPQRSRSPAAGPALAPNVGVSLLAHRAGRVVGLAEEQQALWDLLRSVAEQRTPRVVGLAGPPAVGKSRLGRWFVRHASEHGRACRVTLRPRPGGDFAAPLVEALTRAFRVRGLPLDESIDRITRGLMRRHPGVDSGVVKARLVRHPCEVAHGQAAPDFERLLAVTTAWLGHLARDRPVVVWLDDAHLAPGTAQLLARALERLRDSPVMVILAGRSPYAEWSLREDFVRLSLAPVSHADCVEFVESLLPMAPGWAAEIAGQAGGSPAAARALMAEWIAAGHLAPSRAGFVLRTPGRRPVVDIEGAPVARLRRTMIAHPLGPAAWTALYAAVALGPVVDNAAWLQVCAFLGLQSVERLVSALAAAGLAWDEGDVWGLESPALADYVEEHARASGGWDAVTAVVTPVPILISDG